MHHTQIGVKINPEQQCRAYLKPLMISKGVHNNFEEAQAIVCMQHSFMFNPNMGRRVTRMQLLFDKK